MRSDYFTVAGKGEVKFKEAVAELVVGKKRFIGIGIGTAKNAAASVSNIRIEVDPRVVETVECRGGLGGNWGRGR